MPAQLDWMELFFSSAGRIARAPFLIAVAVLLVILAVYESITGPTTRWLTGWLAYSVLLFSAACVLSKRLHDRGKSGWFAAIVLVAFIAVRPAPAGWDDFLFSLVLIWTIVELGVLPGEQGANRYGPNPQAGASSA